MASTIRFEDTPGRTGTGRVLAARRRPAAGIRGAVATAGVALALAVGGCGGGGGLDPGTIGSGGTGSAQATVAVGPIQGFGSVIVNGVHYDETAASLSDEQGGSVARSALRIGMMVQINGTSDSASATGTAASLKLFSELKGAVAGLTSAGFTVNGVAVRTNAATVIDGTGALADGDYVEVYGVYDASTGAVAATRVERKLVGEYKLRGTVSSWNAFARTFMLAGHVVGYSGLATLPGGFANGVSVRATAATAPGASAWTISALQVVDPVSLASGQRAEIEGYITAFTSSASFVVNGLTVDASSAGFSGGTASALAVGRRVEIEGVEQAGKIVASKVAIEDDSESGGGSTEFEVKGTIAGFTSAARFFVRNTEIDASGSGVVYEGGSALSLANGKCVEIKGTLSSGSGGSVVKASDVKFENDCG